MRARAWVVVVFAPLGISSCSDANKHAYSRAAAATSLQVVAVGINRVLTNDCWARCSPGYLCNQESGLCERGECVPECEYGSHCTHDVTGEYRCVRDADPTVTSLSAQPTPLTR